MRRNDFSLLSVKAILLGGNSEHSLNTTVNLPQRRLIAAGHQSASDHILERFEIFDSMVLLFNVSICDSSVVQSAV